MLIQKFDGIRQDSGDPIAWGEKIIKHLQKHNVDPKTKTAVFSDNLNVESANYILQKFKNKINVVFGIGTNLTNDVGLTPLNIVIKMVKYNGLPVAKISDEPKKHICEDENYYKYLTKIFNDRNNI